MAEGNGNGNGTARWSLWVSVIVAGVAVVAMVGSMATIYAQVVTNTLAANDLKERVNVLTAQVADDRNKINTVCADLVEVETQFKASDQVRNLIHVNDLRNYSILYQRVMKVPYPVGEPYLPTIAQEQPTPCR